jgi:hypothetical protein
MLGPEGLAEEARGGLGITGCTQQKVDGLALRVYSSVKGIPLLLDLDVRLIDAVGVVRRGEIGATALVELRSIALHPPKHGGVIDGDPAFPQQLFDITIA